jgi:hypothetical protein
MKTFYQSLLLALGALALAGAAFAQVPSSNDTSDDSGNTGMGFTALGGPNPVNLKGGSNTASGYQALTSNTTGNFNTASGSSAMFFNTAGSQNTASGVSALANNTTGNDNTASGYEVLLGNTTGGSNTASGFEALQVNTSGDANTADGAGALLANTIGNNNTASGVEALSSNTTGINNIAVGFLAGSNLTTGSDNIDIGSLGLAGESNLIRIGTKGIHKGAVIAGISTTQVTGSAVFVTTSGRLGVKASSERYKTAIAPIGDSTEKLQQLRPVSFHLKSDPKGAVQYGLIAEEVAEVYPELVIRNEAGRIEGVRYDELAPMLLNEVQQQQHRLATQASINEAQEVRMRELEQKLTNLQAALNKSEPKDELVAGR